MKRKDFICSLMLPVTITVFGLFVITYMIVHGFPESEMKFPLVCSILLLICTIPMYIQAFRGEMLRNEITLPGMTKVLIMAAALFIYATVLKQVGFLLDTFALCVFILFYIGYEKKVFGVVYSAILTVVVYTIFKILLGVPLPSGLL